MDHGVGDGFFGPTLLIFGLPTSLLSGLFWFKGIAADVLGCTTGTCGAYLIPF